MQWRVILQLLRMLHELLKPVGVRRRDPFVNVEVVMLPVRDVHLVAHSRKRNA